MKELFRLSRAKYAKDISGEGARLGGGRWNHKGIALIYTAESRALAALEALVHLSHPDMLIGWKMVTLSVPESIVPASLDPSALPADWQTSPPPFALADLGTEWARSRKSLLLRVPSAVVPQEYNVLINPRHPDMKSVAIVKIEDFAYDARLMKAAGGR